MAGGIDEIRTKACRVDDLTTSFIHLGGVHSATSEVTESGLMGLFDNSFNFELFGGGFTDKNGAGHVAAVTLEFGSQVNQHYVPVVDFTIAGGVVRNGAVFS